MSEFDRIDKFFKPLSGLGANNLQDDVAHIPPYVISTDTIVQGTHFIGDEKPITLAQKLLAVNLSDVASCGGKPYGYTLNICVPKGTTDKWFAEFAEGLKIVNDKYNLQLLGGDTVSGGENIVLSATIFANEPKNNPHRGNAKIGDVVCLLGKIGGGVFGLKSAKGEINNKKLLKYYQIPEPNVIEAISINSHINASIDISDGLIADLNHICKASNVGINLNINDIPLVDEIKKYVDEYDDFYEMILQGGDDYVVAITVSQDSIKQVQQEMDNIGKKLYIIGEVINDTNNVRIFDKSGIEKRILKKGYEHK